LQRAAGPLSSRLIGFDHRAAVPSRPTAGGGICLASIGQGWGDWTGEPLVRRALREENRLAMAW
jgi:hypothetical protein